LNFYKYTSINEHSINNLKNDQIYLQSPVNFNDPYEFIFKFKINDKIYIDFLKLIYGDKYLEFIDKRITKEEALAHTRDHYFPEAQKMIGAACFTENENDDIMWAHYGGNHKGICIEYDRTKHPFCLCEQVKYVNEVISIEIENLSDFETESPKIFNEVFLRKNFIWKYEKEWRLLSEANSIVKYLPDAIKSITFGFFCDEKSKSEIYESTAHLDIKYFELVRSKDSYIIQRLPI
jgi:hypothetical protein